jgi:EpsI family protein
MKMQRLSIRVIVIGLAMLVASGLAVAMKPTKMAADQGRRVQLESMIPSQFGDWSIDTSIVPVQISPDLQAKLDKVYDQTLSRTYVNSRRQRIMLSIAYGGSHGEGMQTHRPEICYPAQGFNIDRILGIRPLSTVYGDLPVNRLVASNGPRVEPITYWIVVGDVRTGFGLQMKLAQLRYNITGVIPDGMLVRVSSIDRNEVGAYELQEDFVLSLLASVAEPDRVRLIGKA